MGASAILERVHTLLQGLDASASRALVTPLVRVAEWATSTAGAYPPAASSPTGAIYYLLRTEGDPGRYPDVISGSRRITELVVTLELAMHLDGVVATAAVQLQERIALLEDTWPLVVDLLQDINNLRRAETGWLHSVRFDAGGADAVGNRVVKRGSFVARYHHEMGAF